MRTGLKQSIAIALAAGLALSAALFAQAPPFNTPSKPSVLSVGNGGTGTTTSTGTGSVVLSASPTLTGSPALGTPTATSITLSSGTALSTYAQGSYTGTLTGGATSPTGTINYTIVGNMVTLDAPLFTVTSNATTKTITGMPAAAIPVTQKFFLANASDNSGSRSVSSMTIDTNGTLTLNFGASRAAWTASGTMTVDAFTVSYTKN